MIVTGLAGAGKSTFSRALAARTGLPLVHLDLHAWKPGWVRMDAGELRERHRDVLAGEAWIADGNYHETLALRLARADTVVYLDTPWWTCARRAFWRGIRKPPNSQPPEGCDDDRWQRLRDEWSIVWRLWRSRGREGERELAIVAEHADRVALHLLRSKRDIERFLAAV